MGHFEEKIGNLLSMKLLASIVDALQAERHRKGFGVHSPFAFSVLHDIIAPRYRYYGFGELSALSGRNDAFRIDNHLLFHIAARSGLCRVSLIGDDNPVARDVVRLARPSVVFTDNPADGHTMVYSTVPDLQLLETYAGFQGNVILMRGFSVNEIRKFSEDREYGLLFFSPSLLIYFARREMRFVSYRIRM